MTYLQKFFGHLYVTIRHRYEVLKLCHLAGMPLQGLVHDLSKFSPSEFLPSVKYFTGIGSPIEAQRLAKGFSSVWLHHRGRNKHHWDYWLEGLGGMVRPVKMPYKYVIELVCDWVAAGRVYEKARWDKSRPLAYFKAKLANNEIRLHPDTEEILYRIFEGISYIGVEYLLDISDAGAFYEY